ncbi:hypothetical protein FZI85_25215 [Mycobacterium sp. CBMA293]|uniref:DUF7572 family protein n=1 Tax=unclassified Mycolicibacterium TaxID=2636767 RepID=UPI0012DD66F5|nr:MULTISPECIES: hypothetical protein [unclassified Mycolicibacterium]MUL47616.1 hypothetical protein [Mycolicibacterium sp. CBMA 360]MUL61866.1 hypothetical protein [Mycolicibacterium sp. CBMA 335]MUL68939.1 hypothetical protein [Mycolicibacterium sp. CBMA 311]MUL92844.1 hypothetical protein [Mycolicibacterium sp. CBMA 230]MUM08713.1 hypothetical protein [Mycolicibacterium sp. CBMA 213]
MPTATLVSERLSNFCPTTNHYACDDGTFLVVTVPRFDVSAAIEARTGIRIPVNTSQLPTHTDVFLADADAVPIDADGDPADGMTPLIRVDDCDDFAEALAAAGYELVEAD